MHQGTTNPSDRWVGVGHSDLRDAGAAGRLAATTAISGADPKLLVVFCSDSYDLEELLVGITETSGGVPLVGCSTAGEISPEGPGETGVVVTAFGGSGFSVATSVAGDASRDMRAAGATVAEAIAGVQEKDHKILMILSDGLAGDQQEMVRGAYGVVGAEVPLVGGCAGDDLKMKRTQQLFGDRVVTDAVIAAAISSDAPFGVGVRHGWRPVGDPMLVTHSGDNRVYSLDDRPALDVYLERLAVPHEVATDPAAFARFAMTHPLGLNRRSDEAHVRFVAEANLEDRSIGCIAEIPQGGLVWLMEGNQDSVLDATDDACRDALSQLHQRQPLGLVAFDCIARKGVLGNEAIRGEVERIAQYAGGAAVSGFYTYGEIARTSGIDGFHNQTLVVLAVG